MTTLITGGLGYIGRQLAFDIGAPCIIIDRNDDVFARKDAAMLANYGHQVVFSDYCGREADRVFRENNIDKVVHLAALTSVAEGESDLARYYNENVVKTAYLAGLAAMHGVKNFVFASSAAVYPAGIVTPETAPNPSNWYGRTKWCAEAVLEQLPKIGMSVDILRFFNVVGADPAGRSGKRNGTDVLSRIIDAASKGKKFTLYGGDFRTPDGSAVRDFVSVHDVVRQVKAALADYHRSARVHNVASFKGTSVRELIRLVEASAGQPIDVDVVPARPGEVPLSICRWRNGDEYPLHYLKADVAHAWLWAKGV